MVHRPVVSRYLTLAQMARPVVSFSKDMQENHLRLERPLLSCSSELVVRLDPGFVLEVVALRARSLILSYSFKVKSAVFARVFPPLTTLFPGVNHNRRKLA